MAAKCSRFSCEVFNSAEPLETKGQGLRLIFETLLPEQFCVVRKRHKNQHMRKLLLFFFLPMLFPACFLRRDYKASSFTYTANGQPATLPLVVPNGYAKMEKKDTAGIALQTFYYPNGALLYAAYLTDTTYEVQPFDKTLHQPQIHRLGGEVYKGQDEKELFYRDIRQGNLRFGYRFVPKRMEGLFDSSTNFASLQRGR